MLICYKINLCSVLARQEFFILIIFMKKEVVTFLLFNDVMSFCCYECASGYVSDISGIQFNRQKL